VRFIVDESSGRLIFELLKADGHDSVFVGDVGGSERRRGPIPGRETVEIREDL